MRNKPRLPILNRGHPLARGLYAAWLLYEGAGEASAREVVRHANGGAFVGPPSWGRASLGSYVDFTAGNYYIPTSLSWNYDGPVSVALGVYVPSGPPNTSAFGGRAGAGITDFFQMHLPYAGTLYWDYGSVTSGSPGRLSYSFAGMYDAWVNVVGTSKGIGGNAMSLWYNGRQVASKAASDGPSGQLTSFDLGRAVLDSTYYYDGYIAYLQIYRRVLTPREIRTLNVDPYTVFRRPAPGLVAATQGGAAGTTTVRLNWSDNSEGEDGFSVERKAGAGAYAVINTVAAGVETYDDVGVPIGQTYTYRIRATSAALGDSEYSNEAEVTV